MTLGPLCAFLSSVTWAIGSANYSKMARTHSAFAVNFARAMVAFPCFILMAFFFAGGWDAGLTEYQRLGWFHIGWFTLSMFASYAFGDVLFLWSTQSLGVPGALAIASCFPLWTAAWGVFVQGHPLSAIQLGGLFLTVGGVVTVILTGAHATAGLKENTQRNLVRGVLLGIVTSFLWALNSLAVSEAGQEVSAPVGNTVRMGVAMLLSAILSRLIAPKEPIVMPLGEFRKWSWVFGLEAVLGSYFFMYGLSRSPLTVGPTLASLAPVLSVPVAWAMGLEKFSFFRTLGVGCVVAGLWLLVG